MGRRYVFADEAGNFDFTAGRSATKYFILTTVTLDDCSIGDDLLRLRRELLAQGVHLPDGYFHATVDEQAVRDRVFATLARHEFRVDSVVITKANVVDHLQRNDVRFYKTAWFLHFKYVAPRIAKAGDELLVVAATLGTKKRHQMFRAAVDDVTNQVVAATFQVGAWAAASDPCLQVADYCSWAIQRKWERGDDRSHVLIRDKIASEFVMFARPPRRVGPPPPIPPGLMPTKKAG